MGAHDYTLYDILCRNARLYPDRDAVVCNRRRLSFRRCKEKCDQLAAGLAAGGIAGGDRLAVMAHNSDEYLILYGAAAKIGAIVVAVNWRIQAEELDFVLRDASPKVVFAGPEYQQIVSEVSAGVGGIERLVSIGEGDARDGFQAFESLYVSEDAGSAGDVSADAGFVIMHTAAVEGKPQGALLSQGNLVAVNIQLIDQFSLSADDSHLCMLPLFHIGGLALALAVMHKGGKNVILERFDPALSLQLIEREGATIFFSFPPMLKMITDACRETPADLSSLRKVGGLDHPDTIRLFQEKAPKAKFYALYGQTEAMALTAGLMEERPGSAGRPSLLTEIALFDDYDREVPAGAPGEICARSPAVFLGYWGRDEENAYTFRNGWHHTGDEGRFDGDGYLWYVRRKARKELIKPGGENVYPAEVEKVLLGHEAVAEVSVIGVPDPEWGEAVKAVCVLKEGMSVEPAALSEFAASRIARYKKPKHVVFVRELPRTQDGEIDRERVKRDHGGKF